MKESSQTHLLFTESEFNDYRLNLLHLGYASAGICFYVNLHVIRYFIQAVIFSYIY